jgi:hypothetical protein
MESRDGGGMSRFAAPKSKFLLPSDRVAAMYLGKIVEITSSDQLYVNLPGEAGT